MSTIGWPGVGTGIGAFALTWLIFEIMTPRIGSFTFEPFQGFFDKILPIYLDIAKFIIGLGAGGIVLIIGSSALGTAKRLPQGYASPLFLLAVSVLFGMIFMPLLVLNYEASSTRHQTTNDGNISGIALWAILH